jgi:hypothetical protein
MPYRIAGIDVHKKMLAVVIADVDVAGTGVLNAGNVAPAQVSCRHWPKG